MKKSLLSLGLLAGIFSTNAQVSHVDTEALLYIEEGALMYNGGGMQTRGSGLIDIHGNVMISGVSTDTFRTLSTSNTDLTTAGSNIILRLNDSNNYANSTYGQLYVTGIPQSNLRAFVRKEYRATNHGVYQQMALPFYNKSLTSLASNLGLSSFSNQRNNPSVMYWDNSGMPQFHHLLRTQGTLDKNAVDTDNIVANNAARYYIVGTGVSGNSWDPSSGIKNIDGQIFSDSEAISAPIENAGYELISGVRTPIDYGTGTGSVRNLYNERIRTYLQDSWDYSNSGYFAGTFGRNIYQFGNPFMTNIDVSTLGYNERIAGGDDGNTISCIQGVRYEATGVTMGGGLNASTSAQYITYDETTGIPTGDYTGAIIKPMQAFAIKLRNSTQACQSALHFNNLRRFAYTTRSVDASGQATNPYGVANDRNGVTTNTIKQLRVIGFDANGNEVGKTYFVLSANTKTGKYNGAKLQVTAFNGNLSTREELPTGGEDTSVQNDYWLYINEANEFDFQGKLLPMVANLSEVKNYRFEIAENANAFSNGQTNFVNGGKSFYIEQTPGQYVQIAHNMTIPATAANAGLYYGQPGTEAQLSTQDAKDNTASELYVAFENDTRTHQVVFPKGWQKASVTVFDAAGRKVYAQKEVDATKNHILPLTVQGSYIVEVVSNTGIKAVKKVVK